MKRFNQEFFLLDLRILKLRQHLPGHGTLGYINLYENRLVAVEPVRAFMFMQNRLAPLILDQSLEHDLVIGEFESAERISEGIAIAKKNDLRVVHNAENGLMLLAPERSD
ncbi:MAG: hypothetical protein GY906_25465 [bacterium]|nr:hypothetical protein [bacterium]